MWRKYNYMDFNVEKYLSNLSYINKDFPSLWNEILETVPKLTNRWLPSEANESDPLVALLKLLAITSDKLNYNADKNILELFPATLTQLRSAYNVYESLGYTPDWYVSATTSITIIYNGLINGEADTTTNYSKRTVVIPAFTQVTDDDSEVVYTLLESVSITPAVADNVSVHAMEGTLNDFTVNGERQITFSNLDSQNRLYFTENNIAQNGILISNYSDFSDYTYIRFFTDTTDEESEDFGDTWRRVNNLNQYESDSKVFKLGIDSVTNTVYLQFPDDIGTLIQDGIYIKYIISSGSQGNIGRNDITQFLNVTSFDEANPSDENDVVSLSASTDFTVTNTQSSQNGRDPLDIEEMREQYNRVAGTFNTLVTLRDYENFLYEYTDADGDYIVSNIKVSDRFHDCFGTIKYKGMSTSGSITDHTAVLPSIISTEGGEITQTSEPLMSPYDLRLYPLLYRTPIVDKEQFNETFNIGDVSSKVSALHNEIVGVNNNNDGVLSNAKCISHNFLSDDGEPILIPYELSGQIYLQSSVSTVEASEILSAVEQEIYATLNSRELEWGRMVDYGTVVDNIKASDSRIQYVALNAIQYGDPLIVTSNYTTDLLSNYDVSNVDWLMHGYDTTVRTILSGRKAWTDFMPFYYDYNQSDGDVYSSSSGYTSLVTTVKIQSATVETETVNSFNLFAVGPNETFSVLTPKYNTVTTYGNYLYYVAVMPSPSDSNSTEDSGGTSDNTGTSTVVEDSIKAETPTKLPNGWVIYIFTTRDDAYSFVNNNNTSAIAYTIQSGTIIQATADIKFYSKNTTDTVGNMGSSVSISILTPAVGSIESTNSLTATGNSQANLNRRVYVATNSQGLADALMNSATFRSGYTLLTNEYLFYTDSLGLELGIVGEGTTISSDALIDSLTVVGTDSDVNKLLNGNLSNTFTTWSTVESGVLNYKLNEITTFGENYLIRCKAGDNYVNFYSISTNSNVFFQLSDVSSNPPIPIDTVEYALGVFNDDGTLDTSNLSGAWQKLTVGDTGETMSAMVRMALITGPAVEQVLTSQTAPITISEETTISDDSTKVTLSFISSPKIQTITLTGNPGAVISSSDGSNGKLAIQSSIIIPYQGGSALTFVGDEMFTSFYTYSTDVSRVVPQINAEFISASDLADYFGINLDSTGGATSGDSTATPKLPLTTEYCCIIPYIARGSSSVVNYMLALGASPITFNKDDDGVITVTIGNISSIESVGKPYFVANGATYYDNVVDGSPDEPPVPLEDRYKSVIEILGGSTSMELTSTHLYYSGFCPLYTPSSTEVINTPTSADSFFISAHPFNGFVLPYLKNINLSISQQSITR